MQKGWRPYFLLFVLGFLLYTQALFFDFSYLDDQSLIIENAPIIGSFKNIGTVFTSDAFFSMTKYYYRPILNVSLMLDMHIAGMLPFIYHLSNILIHILVAWLIYRLFIKLNYSRILAWLFAAIFIVHPVLTQAVAWIPGRNDSLLALFVLAAFNLFLEFKESPKLKYFVGYLACLLLALFTKETAALLPVIVIIYFLLIDRKKISKSDKWLLVFGSLAVGIIWYIFRSFALESDPLSLKIVFDSVLRNAPALLVSLGKVFLPFDLAVLPILADAKIVYGLIILPLLLLALFFSKNKRSSYLLLGFSWFILFLLPSLVRLNPIDTPDFLEHRLYLPIIGLFIIIAEIDWIKNFDFRKRISKIIAILLIVFFMALSYRHLQVFKNRISFWQSAVSTSPHSALANRNLGAMYYLDNNLVEAEKSYRQALAINDKEPMAHNNLGLIYFDQGNYGQAEREYKKELSLYPSYDKALVNLGNLYYSEKRLTEAGDLWGAALKSNPRNYEAYSRLLNLSNQLR
ncbi:MAG: tetratricopeptide repeat protein [Candidatus Falkowbacteria bacterium]